MMALRKFISLFIRLVSYDWNNLTFIKYAWYGSCHFNSPFSIHFQVLVQQHPLLKNIIIFTAIFRLAHVFLPNTNYYQIICKGGSCVNYILYVDHINNERKLKARVRQLSLSLYDWRYEGMLGPVDYNCVCALDICSAKKCIFGGK